MTGGASGLRGELDGTLRRVTGPRGVVLVLGLVWGLHLLANAAFLVADPGPPTVADGINQIVRSYDVSTQLKAFGVPGLLREAIHVDPQWPPLVPLVNGTMAHLIDDSLPAVRLYNMVYLGLLLVSVFWIGAHCHSRAAGLLAAVCCSFVPSIYGASRQFGLDFPASAAVAATIACLLATRGFCRLRASALCGVALGLSLLCRAQVVLFLVGPCVLVLLRSLTRRGSRARALLGAGACLAVALVTSALWWWGNLERIGEHFFRHVDKQGVFLEGDPSLAGGIAVYLGSLPEQLTPPLMLLALALAVVWLRRRRTGRWELLLWLLVPLVLHILSVARNLRYLIPLLPALPLMAAMGALSLRRPALRAAAVILLLVTASGAWLACQGVWPGVMPITETTGDSILRHPCAKQFCSSAEFNGAATDGAWHRHRVTRALAGELKTRLPPEGLVVLAERPPPAAVDGRVSRDVVLGLRGLLHRTVTMPDSGTLRTRWTDLRRRPFTLLLVASDPEPPDVPSRLAASWLEADRSRIWIWELPPSLPKPR